MNGVRLDSEAMAGLDEVRGGAPIKVGVSACLLGRAVRYDGGHKRNAWLTEVFGRHVEWVPICPEVELGMPTPREPIRLEKHSGAVRLVAPQSGADHTDAMRSYARRRVRGLVAEGLCGYVFKKDSPSCGVWEVRVYEEGGASERKGRGLFAAALIGALPNLPVEEEGRLSNPEVRATFMERILAYHRLNGSPEK